MRPMRCYLANREILEVHQLSAEASSFRPNEVHAFTPGYHSEQKRSPSQTVNLAKATTSASLQHLPKYVTNCYPFVTADNGYHPRLVSPSPRFASAPSPTNISFVRHHHVSNAGLTTGASNVTNMTSYSPSAPFNGIGIQPPNYIQLPDSSNQSALPSQSAFVPVAVPQNIVSGASFSPANVMQHNQQQYVYTTGPAVSGLNQFVSYPPPTAVPWLGFPMPPPGQPVYIPTDPAGRPRLSTPTTNTMVATSVDKKAKDTVPVKKSNVRTKVIICRDSSCQTDFNDELAKQTLLERPSVLYVGDSVAGAEDVDSDSGYNSPQHRQTAGNNSEAPTSNSSVTARSSAISSSGTTAAATQLVASQGTDAICGPAVLQLPGHTADTPRVQAPMTVPAYQFVQLAPYTSVIPSVGRGTVPLAPAGGLIPILHNTGTMPLMPGAGTVPVIRNSNGLSGFQTGNGVSMVPAGSSRLPLVQAADGSVPLLQCVGNSIPLVANMPIAPSAPYSVPLAGGVRMPSPAPSVQMPPRFRSRYSPRQETRHVSVGSKMNESCNSHYNLSSVNAMQGVRHQSPGPQSLVDSANGPAIAHTVPPPLPTSLVNEQHALPFGDVDEFPILLSAAGGLVASHGPSCQFTPPSAFGAASGSVNCHIPMHEIRTFDVSSINRQRRSSGRFSNQYAPDVKTIPGLGLSDRDVKAARKKQKRQEIANRAAEKELAEISLEQQVLRELRVKQLHKAPEASSSSAPVVHGNRAASSVMADSLQSQSTQNTISQTTDSAEPVGAQDTITMQPNTSGFEPAEESLDAMSNIGVDQLSLMKQWKNKEMPKTKKPSTLKKIILKEREEKKRHQILNDDDDPIAVPTTGDNSDILHGVILNKDELPSVDAIGGEVDGPPSGNLSPVSQMSPYNMSPMSGSPAGSAGVSPIAGEGMLGSYTGPGASSIASKIHSRRFREYCNQVLDKEIDDCCTRLLQDLVRFQDRGFSKDPTKVKRRIVMGLREVSKHLKLNQLKCIIISPNMERIQSKGGLDEALNKIIETSRQQNVPFVFALGRRALGRVCAKLVPVSIVGIFCYEGTEDNFHQLCQLTEKARKAYNDMVTNLEQEMVAVSSTSAATAAAVSNNNSSTDKDGLSSATGVPRGPITGNLGGFEKLFPHLGHSRTPSACSAISIISSVLSEPVSETYPASDPDMDTAPSRGHDSKDAQGRKMTDLDTVGESREEGQDFGLENSEKTPSGPPSELVHAGVDIDAGHEADTEDDSESVDNRVVRHSLATSHHGSVVERAKSEASSEHGRSAKSGGKLTGGNDRSPAVVASAAGVIEDLGGSMTMAAGVVKAVRSPAIDSKRIESWVAESQRAIEKLRVKSSSRIGRNCSDEVDVDEDEEEDDDLDQINEISDKLDVVAIDHQTDGGSGVHLDHFNSDAVAMPRLQEETGGDDDDDIDDNASMKTVDDDDDSSSSSKSHYVEASEGATA